MLKQIVASLCVSVGAINALGQHSVNPNVTYATFEVRGWEFAPVTDASRVIGFLARLIDEDVVGDSEWTTWGWDHNDPGLATLWVRQYLDDDSALSLDMELADLAASSDEESVEQPIEMVSGLFWSDPLLDAVAGSTDPEASLEFLIEQGHEAAPVMSPLAASTVDCGPTNVGGVEAMLTLLAVQTETTYFGIAATSSSNCTLACLPCMRTQGPTTCGGWIFDYSVPAAGGGLTCHYYKDCSYTLTWTGEKRKLLGGCKSCGRTDLHSFRQTGRNSVGQAQPCSPPD